VASLARSRRAHHWLAIGIARDVQRPGATADITITDELSFVRRVDVDFDQLE